MLSAQNQTTLDDHGSEGERITDPKQIMVLLRQLLANHELLNATVQGCPDSANTAILGIKEDHNYFLLDELSSPSTHKRFEEFGKAFLRGRLRGTELHFDCKLIKAGRESNIALYAVSIPTEIIRKQRRDQFRLRLSPAISAPVMIPSLDGLAICGETYDLSSCGLGAILNTETTPKRGQILAEVSIQLPSSNALTTTLEVRFCRLDNTRHMLRLGARFLSLDQKQQRKLEHFLAEQQRKQCRHDPR